MDNEISVATVDNIDWMDFTPADFHTSRFIDNIKSCACDSQALLDYVLENYSDGYKKDKYLKEQFENLCEKIDKVYDDLEYILTKCDVTIKNK